MVPARHHLGVVRAVIRAVLVDCVHALPNSHAVAVIVPLHDRLQAHSQSDGFVSRLDFLQLEGDSGVAGGEGRGQQAQGEPPRTVVPLHFHAPIAEHKPAPVHFFPIEDMLERFRSCKTHLLNVFLQIANL
jgi:hypothetical protein